MIHLRNKAAVIGIYEESGRPLDKDLLDELESVDAELTTLGKSHEFVIMEVECRICTYRQTAIVPAIVDLDNLECFNCENMTSQEYEPKEWEKD